MSARCRRGAPAAQPAAPCPAALTQVVFVQRHLGRDGGHDKREGFAVEVVQRVPDEHGCEDDRPVPPVPADRHRAALPGTPSGAEEPAAPSPAKNRRPRATPAALPSAEVPPPSAFPIGRRSPRPAPAPFRRARHPAPPKVAVRLRSAARNCRQLLILKANRTYVFFLKETGGKRRFNLFGRRPTENNTGCTATRGAREPGAGTRGARGAVRAHGQRGSRVHTLPGRSG